MASSPLPSAVSSPDDLNDAVVAAVAFGTPSTPEWLGCWSRPDLRRPPGPRLPPAGWDAEV